MRLEAKRPTNKKGDDEGSDEAPILVMKDAGNGTEKAETAMRRRDKRRLLPLLIIPPIRRR